MHDLEMKYIQEAFDTNWVAPLGKNVDEFEKEIISDVIELRIPKSLGKEDIFRL